MKFQFSIRYSKTPKLNILAHHSHLTASFVLWKFNKDIQNLLIPEINRYKWNSESDCDDWKRFLEIYENNPNQNAYNLYFGERDNRINRVSTP